MNERAGRTNIIPVNNIKSLKRYFGKREDVLMAFLFGSGARNALTLDSDLDIAVYFTPKGRRVEFEDPDAHYRQEHDLWLDLERILKREVELLVLNRAGATVSDSALRGVPIKIKDRGLYLDFILRVTREAEDFRNFIEEYWRLKEKAKE